MNCVELRAGIGLGGDPVAGAREVAARRRARTRPPGRRPSTRSSGGSARSTFPSRPRRRARWWLRGPAGGRRRGWHRRSPGAGRRGRVGPSTATIRRCCAPVQQRGTFGSCCDSRRSTPGWRPPTRPRCGATGPATSSSTSTRCPRSGSTSAIRNAAGVFDSSPLYKYRITGPDAERYLAGVLARDVRTCRPGQAQYTIWCDERGFVNEDGVVFRYGADEFLLTAAEPNLAYFQDLVGYDRVEIEEVSEQYGSLAIQGPRAHADPQPAGSRGRAGSATSTTRPPRSATCRSRSRAPGSPATSGSRCSVKPATPTRCGTSCSRPARRTACCRSARSALLMARIEAGLLLIHVDFDASRLAENDEHRSTPLELGLQWMLKGIDDDTRPFIGRKAILRERADGTSRWKMMGLMVDPFDYHAKYTERRHGAAQGPHARPRGHDGVRRRRAARRLRHELHVLARAAAPHRPGPHPTRARQGRARRSTSSSRSTTATCRSAPRSPATRCSPPQRKTTGVERRR